MSGEQVKAVTKEEIDHLASEIELGRAALLQLGSSLQLTHSSVVQLSQELDAKIVKITQMQIEIKQQENPIR